MTLLLNIIELWFCLNNKRLGETLMEFKQQEFLLSNLFKYP